MYKKYSHISFSKPFPSNRNTINYIKKAARAPTATINPKGAPVVNPSDFVPPVEEAVLDPVAAAAADDVAPPAAAVAAELAPLATLPSPEEAAEATEEAADSTDDAPDKAADSADEAPDDAAEETDEAPGEAAEEADEAPDEAEDGLDEAAEDTDDAPDEADDAPDDADEALPEVATTPPAGPPDPEVEDPPPADPDNPLILLNDANADASLEYGTPTVTAARAALSPVDPILGVPVTEDPEAALVADPPAEAEEEIDPNCP